MKLKIQILNEINKNILDLRFYVGLLVNVIAIKLYSRKDIFKHACLKYQRLWFKISKIFEGSIMIAPQKSLLLLLNPLIRFFCKSKQVLKRRVGY